MVTPTANKDVEGLDISKLWSRVDATFRWLLRHTPDGNINGKDHINDKVIDSRKCRMPASSVRQVVDCRMSVKAMDCGTAYASWDVLYDQLPNGFSETQDVLWKCCSNSFPMAASESRDAIMS